MLIGIHSIVIIFVLVGVTVVCLALFFVDIDTPRPPGL
jgi:hypothetical protein